MTVPSARATPGTLRAWRARALRLPLPPARGALCRAADLTQRVSRARLGDVVGALAVELRPRHGVGETRDLLQQPVEHLLLVSEHRLGEPLGLGVTRGAREPDKRGVGGDLQRLRRAAVLGVLEHLLLAPGPANEIERGLGQRQRLADEALERAQTGLERVVALPQLAQPDLDALGVPPRLAKVALQPIAVPTLRGHRDLRLQLPHQRQLCAMRLVQVLHDLLLLLLVHEVKLS